MNSVTSYHCNQPAAALSSLAVSQVLVNMTSSPYCHIDKIKHNSRTVIGMASMKAAGELDDESEDEDFDIKGKEDDEGEPTDESEAESGDAEMVDEDRPKVCPQHCTPDSCAVTDSANSSRRSLLGCMVLIL